MLIPKKTSSLKHFNLMDLVDLWPELIPQQNSTSPFRMFRSECFPILFLDLILFFSRNFDTAMGSLQLKTAICSSYQVVDGKQTVIRFPFNRTITYEMLWHLYTLVIWHSHWKWPSRNSECSYKTIVICHSFVKVTQRVYPLISQYHPLLTHY